MYVYEYTESYRERLFVYESRLQAFLYFFAWGKKVFVFRLYGKVVLAIRCLLLPHTF